MTPNIEAAREAARILKSVYLKSNPERIAADALLWLTDPTPLSWDVASKEPEANRNSFDQIKLGIIRLTFDGPEQTLIRITINGLWIDRFMWPRTLGELRQLILRANT